MGGMNSPSRIVLRCVGCKAQRTVTHAYVIKKRGRTFCPSCGNLEIGQAANGKVGRPKVMVRCE
jgi:uncharacterized Zn finger protein (UPF0148 family)